MACEEAARALSVLAAHLPASLGRQFGFECRLDIPDPWPDFLVCLQTSQGGRDVLAKRGFLDTLPAESRRGKAWRAVARFARAWADPGTVLYPGAHNLWLEFDLRPGGPSIPEPSLFFGLLPDRWLSGATEGDAPQPDRMCRMLETGFRAFRGRPLPRAQRSRLEHSLGVLPPPAEVFQAGIMLGRPDPVIRLCLRQLPLAEIPLFLERLDWPGRFSEWDALLEGVARQISTVSLQIEFGSRLHPKLGLECFLPSLAWHDTSDGWASFLDLLVDKSLCLPPKRDALLGFSGAIRLSDTPDWPSDLSASAALLGFTVVPAFKRFVSHVKITLVPGAPPIAKAYLGILQVRRDVNHLFTANRFLAPPPDPRSLPAQKGGQ